MRTKQTDGDDTDRQDKGYQHGHQQRDGLLGENGLGRAIGGVDDTGSLLIGRADQDVFLQLLHQEEIHGFLQLLLALHFYILAFDGRQYVELGIE